MHTLKSLKPAHRTIILDHLDAKSQRSIYDAIHKVITSRQVSNTHKNRLKRILAPHAADLRYLTDKHKQFNGKKKKLVQMGGQLGAILAAAIPVLLDLLMTTK